MNNSGNIVLTEFRYTQELVITGHLVQQVTSVFTTSGTFQTRPKYDRP